MTEAIGLLDVLHGFAGVVLSSPASWCWCSVLAITHRSTQVQQRKCAFGPALSSLVDRAEAVLA